MAGHFLAIDLGMSVIDVLIETESGLRSLKLENDRLDVEDQYWRALAAVGEDLSPNMTIGVTGGRYRDLPTRMGNHQVDKVDEIVALGRGGLALAGLETGLVVGAGTGAAMVAARPRVMAHVTGSAVGGGTLVGLSKLILGTDDVKEIDRLALAGDAAQVDIMLTEAVGGKVGRLPEHANAVNLGKLDRETDFSRENLAAGLARLVAQVIAVIAINAAAAEGLDDMIMVGHLMDLKSIRREVRLVGEFYQRRFIIPDNPGIATVTGVLEALQDV